MRLSIRRAAASAVLATVLGACADNVPLAPLLVQRPFLAGASANPVVRISEIHYDNGGTDAGEAIEVSAPTGTDLTGWSVVLYNGNGGAAYDTRPLSGVVVDACSGRGVVVLTYAVNGIQNGAPDGMALVDNTGALVEFLSYEGSFAATSGAAAGATSTDIGVNEAGTEPLGQSLQRQPNGTWGAPAASTFGSCNDNGTAPPPATVTAVTISPNGASLAVAATQQFTATATDSSGATVPTATFTWSSSATSVATVSASGLVTAVAPGTAQVIATEASGMADTVAVTVQGAPPPTSVRFSEIHYDNAGTDVGEAIEVEGPAGTDLTGWSVVLYNGNGGGVYNTASLSGTIPNVCSGRGVVVVNYPSNGIQNGNPDGFALVDAAGSLVEFLSYGGSFVGTAGAANGIASRDILAAEVGVPIGQSLQLHPASNLWQLTAATFGACYGQTPPPPTNSITFSGRTSSDPALPVGFEDQLFATLRDGAGTVLPTTFTWSSETPAIATVDANGVVHALSVGTFIVRATAADGTTATYSLDTQVATAGGTAQYGNNTEFGVPLDGDASDDLLVSRAEFTSSFNPARGIPNWVSYDLDASHIGGQDRCDCFTFDPALPASLPRYTTADYTGAGTFAGYGIDRGHLARSFDRSTGLLDNASTFYFSNIIPQAADNNQGPWAALENFLGDEARVNDREVYIIAGASGNKGTVKGEGKITIPAYTWKVAVTVPRNTGLAGIDDPSDLTVLAVVMPNDPGIRSIPWQTYEVTVDSVEALSGYNLLALLPDQVEIAVESKTKAPIAAVDGPYTSKEGSGIAMSGAASTDPDGDALTYAWSFGDGTLGTGVSASHTYAQDGSYTVQLTVTDARGLSTTTATTATIANVAPSIAALASVALYPGERYTANGSFTDPGVDPWSATVDYGLGGGPVALALTGKTFALSQVYATVGTFTVRVSVADDDANASRTMVVNVLSVADGILGTQAALQLYLAMGRISQGGYQQLNAMLGAALNTINNGQRQAAIIQLDNVQRAIRRLEASGELSKGDAATLRTLMSRFIRSLSLP
ncbi:MAG: DNA/RNA non-specific endonuclease [Gemmatimonadaceae bacterium]|nr:DNA/RNA non-specific endonuclease [Gemmatimonadaceae bacterium]